ncbi:MAG TPA: ribonuclease P protein component [Candidatus Dojkabacteria bacterium]|nr:ribonuclease P protein component [Candidatus Dojkabacteria bacterium]
MIPKRYRLPAKDFEYVYRNGKRFKGKFGMLIWYEDSSLTSPCFGFVVNKKIGNSVKRHRLTRMLRVISRDAMKEFNLDNVGVRFEYIAFCFPDSFSSLKSEFFEQIKKACLK